MVGSLIVGVNHNPPLQIIRCLSLERKTHEHGGHDGTKMCSRRFVCFFCH